MEEIRLEDDQISENQVVNSEASFENVNLIQKQYEPINLDESCKFVQDQVESKEENVVLSENTKQEEKTDYGNYKLDPKLDPFILNQLVGTHSSETIIAQVQEEVVFSSVHHEMMELDYEEETLQQERRKFLEDRKKVQEELKMETDQFKKLANEMSTIADTVALLNEQYSILDNNHTFLSNERNNSNTIEAKIQKEQERTYQEFKLQSQALSQKTKEVKYHLTKENEDVVSDIVHNRNRIENLNKVYSEEIEHHASLQRQYEEEVKRNRRRLEDLEKEERIHTNLKTSIQQINLEDLEQEKNKKADEMKQNLDMKRKQLENLQLSLQEVLRENENKKKKIEQLSAESADYKEKLTELENNNFQLQTNIYNCESYVNEYGPRNQQDLQNLKKELDSVILKISQVDKDIEDEVKKQKVYETGLASEAAQKDDLGNHLKELRETKKNLMTANEHNSSKLLETEEVERKIKEELNESRLLLESLAVESVNTEERLKLEKRELEKRLSEKLERYYKLKEQHDTKLVQLSQEVSHYKYETEKVQQDRQDKLERMKAECAMQVEKQRKEFETKIKMYEDLKEAVNNKKKLLEDLQKEKAKLSKEVEIKKKPGGDRKRLKNVTETFQGDFKRKKEKPSGILKSTSVSKPPVKKVTFSSTSKIISSQEQEEEEEDSLDSLLKSSLRRPAATPTQLFDELMKQHTLEREEAKKASRSNDKDEKATETPSSKN